MLIRSAALLGLCGLSAVAPSRADPSAARTLIAHCAEVTPREVRGLNAMREACPGIEQALEQLGVKPFLPADWTAELSPRALSDLAALEARYAGPPPRESTRPDAGRLRSIALGLKPPPTPSSWWERFGRWVQHWFERATRERPGWLRFLPHFPVGPRVRRVLFVALAALVAAGAGAVVFIEARAVRDRSGLRSGLVRRRFRAGAASPVDSPAGLLDLAALGSAPARDRPVLLLRALVQALTRAHRLEGDRELTCRELIERAHFDTPAQRDDFRQVALLAERALYGGRQAAPPIIPGDVLRSARALRDQLLAAPKAPEAG